jgi:hypothetical protein
MRMTMRTTTTGTTTGTGMIGARSSVALAGLAGALAVGLTACGGSGAPASANSSGTTPAAASASSSAPAPSTSSSSASPTEVAVPSLADLTTRMTSAARSKSTARLVTTSSATSGAQSTGAIRFRASGVDFAATTLAAGRTVKMVFIGGAAYMNVGEPYQGKHWLHIAPGGSDPLSKALSPILTQLSTSLDIKSQLAAAKGSKITSAKRTQLGGVPATHYTLVSTEAALLAQLDKFAPTPALRKTLRSQFKGAHAESELWLGEGDLPLRVDSRVVGASVPASTTSVTYSDWGKPVTISAPPRSDVVDLAR